MCFRGLLCRILENSTRNGEIRLRNYIVYVGTPQIYDLRRLSCEGFERNGK